MKRFILPSSLAMWLSANHLPAQVPPPAQWGGALGSWLAFSGQENLTAARPGILAKNTTGPLGTAESHLQTARFNSQSLLASATALGDADAVSVATLFDSLEIIGLQGHVLLRIKASTGISCTAQAPGDAGDSQAGALLNILQDPDSPNYSYAGAADIENARFAIVPDSIPSNCTGGT